jgi:glycerophosphoryl diester phosphodiesterase
VVLLAMNISTLPDRIYINTSQVLQLKKQQRSLPGTKAVQLLPILKDLWLWNYVLLTLKRDYGSIAHYYHLF